MKVLWVVPYIGTWIETYFRSREQYLKNVVPYIGTWIETTEGMSTEQILESYLI